MGLLSTDQSDNIQMLCTADEQYPWFSHGMFVLCKSDVEKRFIFCATEKAYYVNYDGIYNPEHFKYEIFGKLKKALLGSWDDRQIAAEIYDSALEELSSSPDISEEFVRLVYSLFKKTFMCSSDVIPRQAWINILDRYNFLNKKDLQQHNSVSVYEYKGELCTKEELKKHQEEDTAKQKQERNDFKQRLKDSAIVNLLKRKVASYGKEVYSLDISLSKILLLDSEGNVIEELVYNELGFKNLQDYQLIELRNYLTHNTVFVYYDKHKHHHTLHRKEEELNEW